jgi:cell division protein FtsI (penicillin-binding protein 3)
MSLLFGVLIARFYRVQIAEHDQWKERAQAQHEGIVKEPFRRGTIYANDQLRADHPVQKIPLVLDVPKFHLHIDPGSIPLACKETMVERLGAREEFFRRSRNRRIQKWLTAEEREEIEAWWGPFAREHRIAKNALFFVRDYQRCHPFGSMLGQLLHTIRDDKDEVTRQGFPTGGLEASLHPYLSGKQGRRLVIRSPRRPLAAGGMLEPAEDGADVTLTISAPLQAIAEEEVAKGVAAAEAKSGWAIVMEPRTGQILAWAQYPPFDPDNYRDTFNDPERISESTLHGMSYAFEPGSTMKPIGLAICLEANRSHPIFTPEEKVANSDGRFPGRSRPISEVRKHNFLNLNMAVQKSANIYGGRITERVIDQLGNNWYGEKLKSLGFGEKVGVDLPGESAGLLPNPERWELCVPYSLQMGYNLLATSLQMLRAWSPLTNGGYRVEPCLVKRIERGDEVLFDLSTHLTRERVLSPETVTRMVEALKYTTQQGGSAWRGKVPGYTTFGKTGTSEKVIDGQYAKDVHFSTFIGATPADRPELLILVAIDEPCYSMRFGGLCAGPVFRSIASRCLPIIGTTPDDPDATAWKAENRRLQEIYTGWNTPGG